MLNRYNELLELKAVTHLIVTHSPVVKIALVHCLLPLFFVHIIGSFSARFRKSVSKPLLVVFDVLFKHRAGQGRLKVA